ncbi:MAG: flagellar motor switch protein FliN [Lentisphaeraceae bacterium]|nr:flagellar motor switch protein FliN [Lentisphaeraceae bacterium]
MPDEVAGVEFGGITPNEEKSTENSQRNLQMLHNLSVDINVRLGSTIMTIRELLNLYPGTVIELDRLAGEHCDLYVNDIMIGKGEVVVINDNFGLRITEIISSEDRLKSI